MWSPDIDSWAEEDAGFYSCPEQPTSPQKWQRVKDRLQEPNKRIRKLREMLSDKNNELRSKMRQRVTGDASKSVRDHLRTNVKTRRDQIEQRIKLVQKSTATKLQQPQTLRVVDRIAFTFGVLGIVLTEWMLLMMPEHFSTYYCAVIAPLLTLRWYFYKASKMQYFLIDFCYFVQMLHILQIIYPSEALFRLCFVFSNGPLAWAIVAWGNSLVFHSLDKVTSVFIHAFPPLLCYCWRWHPHPSYNGCVGEGWGCDPTSLSLYDAEVLPVVVYLMWQAGYLFETEVHSKHIFEKDPEVTSSLRWFAQKGHNMYTVKIVRKICISLGLMHKDETFDPASMKTKAVMVFTQLLYTFVTLLPTPLLYAYKEIHQGFLLYLLMQCVWNGATYYFEVFASTYAYANKDKARKGAPMREEKEIQAATPTEEHSLSSFGSNAELRQEESTCSSSIPGYESPTPEKDDPCGDMTKGHEVRDDEMHSIHTAG